MYSTTIFYVQRFHTGTHLLSTTSLYFTEILYIDEGTCSMLQSSDRMEKSIDPKNQTVANS